MESQLWEFRDFRLGVLRQNDLWVLVPWLGTKYTIRGKVVASPKSRPWWILWIRDCVWFVRAPKYFNYAPTNLLFGLCRFVWVIELLVNLPSPHPGTTARPSIPEVLWTRERALILSPFVVFTFGLAVESIMELGGASKSFKWLIFTKSKFLFHQFIVISMVWNVEKAWSSSLV
jgi:hypothetical protein